MPDRPDVRAPDLGQGPSNATPDLSTDSAQRSVASGVKAEGATGESLQPGSVDTPDAKDLTGGATPDAEPNLDPADIKPTKK